MTVEDAVAEARAVFLACERLDMKSLAARLGTSRATLYRLTGGRDRLLGEVVWSLSEMGLARARAETTSAGADALVETAVRFMRMVNAFEPMRFFLRSEPETALRVLSTPAGRVVERFTAVWHEAIAEAIAAGIVRPRFDPAALSYLLARIGESLLFGHVVANCEPDVELAGRIMRLLLD